jgi:hypothetical protein
MHWGLRARKEDAEAISRLVLSLEDMEDARALPRRHHCLKTIRRLLLARSGQPLAHPVQRHRAARRINAAGNPTVIVNALYVDDGQSRPVTGTANYDASSFTLCSRCLYRQRQSNKGRQGVPDRY